jgi:hypothetical protein
VCLKDLTFNDSGLRTRLNNPMAVSNAGLKRLVNDCNVEPLRGCRGNWVSRAVPAILAFQPRKLNFNDQEGRRSAHGKQAGTKYSGHIPEHRPQG